MTTQIETTEREVVLVEDAHIRPMMGLGVLEPRQCSAVVLEIVTHAVQPFGLRRAY